MRRALTICHVIHSGGTGGGPSVLLDAVRLSTDRGYRSVVMCGGDGFLAAELRTAGVRTIDLRYTGKLSFALSVPRLVRCFAHEKIDVVLLYGQFAGFYGAIAGRLAGVPAIYEAHFPSFVTDAGIASRARNHLAEWVSCRLTRATTVVSEADRREYVRRRLQTPDRLYLVPNGVEVRAADPAGVRTIRRNLGAEGTCLLVAAGRLERQKGFDVLLQALPAVLRMHPDARLALLGEGPERAALHALVRKLALEATVTILPFQRPLDPWLQAADVVVVPSRYEPGGLVAREAMAAARPVVASDVQGLAEAIEHDTTGLLVPPDDPQRLADALNLLQDQELRQRLGQAARVAAESFSRQAMWAGYEAVIERVCTSRP